MKTPWGTAQQLEKIAPGIVRVQTAGHGGLFCSPEIWSRIILQFPTQKRYAPDGWLEEDCDWALAALACPELFSPRDCMYAVQTFENYADGYGAPTAAWLKTHAARAVRERAALAVTKEIAVAEFNLPTGALA